MMAPEPLRSALISGTSEDTSLALPSDNKQRSRQQRVLEQVHTIKRSKSKPGSPSPTALSPQTLKTFTEFGTFKFFPPKANGTLSHTMSTKSMGYTKAKRQYNFSGCIFSSDFRVNTSLSTTDHSMNTQKTRSLSTKTVAGRSGSTWEQQFNSCVWPLSPNGIKSSRSDPALAPPFSPRAKGQVSQNQTSQNQTFLNQTSQNQHTLQSRANRYSTISNSFQMTSGQTATQPRAVQPPSLQSHNESKISASKTSKTELQSAVNSTTNMSDLTLKEAVEFLSNPEENFQQCGATFIQHTTFKEERAKQEVFQLGGIPVLVALLRSPNTGVSQAAAGALRNLVFKDQNNKMEVQHCGGIAKALQLLKETDSTETQKQITGLLWNLSSADELKEELISTALPALTENVVVPFTCWSDNSANNNIHPDVFYSATGCLRNLSCAQQKERQAMRDCRGLIDSLMSYMQSCVAEENPDDKSVENCACILHNLTYQLEAESPECFAKYNPSASQSGSVKSPTVGCFSPKSAKAQKEFSYDAVRGMPEDSSPSGVMWLCHPKAMQTYLSLLGSSKKDATLEACCGALQNLTASKGLGSSAMSQILVQKLKALLHIPALLKSTNRSLQKTAMSLLGNMSRTSSLQATMAKQVLPDLTGLISSGPRKMGSSDETIAATCSTARNLMIADAEVSKKVINKELVSSLADLSENESFPKGRKAASLLLYSLWNEKHLQGIVKKLGVSKTLFVNENTSAVHKSLQVID